MYKINRIDSRYCVGCGTCVTLCPRKAIGFSVLGSDIVAIVDESRCTDCGLCVLICPGINNVYVDDRSVLDSLLREFRVKAVYFGWSRDENIRFWSASGGIVTSFLRYLVEKKVVSYVLVTKHRFLSAYPNITGRVEDIVRSSGSIYFKTFTLAKLGKLLELVRRGHRVAIVGLPCMLGVVRKVLPRKLRERVIFIGLVCYHINTFWYLKYVFSKFSPSLRAKPISVSPRKGGWPGKIVLRYRVNNSVKEVEVGHFSLWNAIPRFEFTAPKGCLYCYDHIAVGGDVVVADAWHPKFFGKDTLGVSLVIVKTDKGLELIRKAAEEGFIELIDAKSVDAYTAQYRNFFIRTIQTLVRRAIFYRRFGVIFKFPREAFIEILRLAIISLLERVPFIYAYAITRVFEKLIYIFSVPSIEGRLYIRYRDDPQLFFRTIKVLTLKT